MTIYKTSNGGIASGSVDAKTKSAPHSRIEIDAERSRR
jgi:hypothetical protein